MVARAWRVAELKATSVTLVHDPHRDFRGQVRIDENHVAEFEAGGLHDCLHTVECQIDLGCRIIRNLSAGGIAAWHARYEQPVVRENARRS